MQYRVITSLTAILCLAVQLISGEEKLDFNRDIRPILSDKCFRCHGTDETTREGSGDGLRLDTEEGAKRDLGGYFAILPGKPAQSELVKRIRSSDADAIMPPPKSGKQLKPAEMELLERWISQGANYKKHWAYVAPVAAKLPEVKQHDWPKNGIDSFILARLESAGFHPNASADRYTLIRRVYLDLIGLPPTIAEADAFVNDTTPNAYEKVVDQLLQSPRYGERWARRWLDLARYADTNGYEKDRPRTIWPYRDWVIKALNDDMPYDQFTIRQLAGDMLTHATPEDRIATGFHRNTMLNEEGGIDPLEFRFYAMVDRVNTTGATWLGLTLGCVQCHTHKYDPITHSEYYGIMGLLNNADEPTLELATAEQEAKRKETEQQIARLEADLPNQFRPAARQWSRWEKPDFSATSSAKGEIQNDQSILITGESPARDTYKIVFHSSADNIEQLKLETITDGTSGPGRTPHGNFVLCEISVSVAPRDNPAATTPVKIARATADFSQTDYPVEHAVDGNPQTGWAVDGEGRKNRTATFDFEKPVSFVNGSIWTVELQQQHGSQHTLGHFRLQLGSPGNASANDSQSAWKTAFTAWERTASQQAVQWKVVAPIELKSNLPLLTLQPDHSILSSGDISKRDVYDLSLPPQEVAITAIRLEALPDSSLPNHGPGRIYYEGPAGDFFLSEISARSPAGALPFQSTKHSFASGKFLSSHAIDGDPQSGWSINGKQGEAQRAMFVFKEPVPASTAIQLQLLFERYYAAALGRFRISVTSDPQPMQSALWPPEVEAALAVAQDQRTEPQQTAVRQHFFAVTPELANARKKIDQLRQSLKSRQTTLVMQEWPMGKVRPTTRYHRGEYLQPKEVVSPGVPAFLPSLPPGAAVNRLTFAEWLVSRENPLTARVAVNRQWHAFFGRGLVRTLEDFGYQGELPSHPELLDYLAVQFMDGGWSLKKLHKLIVMSATYQQSSHATPELLARDPQNVLLARGPRVRLEAELIRDSLLRAAGLLSEKMYGPSVFPPQPASVTSEGTYGQFQWNISSGEDRYRRSIYTFAKRTAPFAMFTTFDAPPGEFCAVRREVSNSPLQGLTLLNDSMFLEVAQAFGKEYTTQTGSLEEKIASLFRRCLTRPPEASETQKLVKFWQQQHAYFLTQPNSAKQIAGDGSGDEATRATWTMLARVLMNLDETVTKP
jgi:hypothetical protein